MNFSETITHSGLITVSPDSKYIAISRGANLNIYLTTGADLISNYPLPDVPCHIQWSPNSQYLLTSHPRRFLLHVYSMQDSTWSGRIPTGPSGIAGLWWSASSAHICVVADFQLRLSVWSLAASEVLHIRSPKFEDRGFSFTANGKFMLLVERSEGKDYLGIYFTVDWQLVQHFLVEALDVADARWANDTSIVVADNCVVYQLLVYSPLGQVLARHRPYESGLGIKCLSLSPGGVYLAVGSYDQSLRVFTSAGWRLLAELPHRGEGSSAHVYKEEEYKEGYAEERNCSRYVVQDLPQKMPCVKVAKDKPNPQTGVGCCEWSWNNEHIATRNGDL